MTDDAPTDFPAVRAAMALRTVAFNAARSLGSQPGFDRREERVEWKRRHDNADAAEAAVIGAYASEMLPAILGGTWRRSESSLYLGALGPSFQPSIYVAGNSLLDHPLHFRRLDGPRGKLTRRNCAILGQPYLSKRADGPDDSWSLTDAGSLACLGFDVWARRDLSAHYPNWTTLVVAAAGLAPHAAAGFGFTALAATVSSVAA